MYADHIHEGCTTCVDSHSLSASEDYDAVIQNISFAAFSSGSQQQCFNAFTNQDTIAEGLEAFRATIADTGDSRVILGNPAVAVVDIIDDDCTYMKTVISSHTASLSLTKNSSTSPHVFLCTLLSAAVVVQFERSMYEGSEGERVEVCAVLIGTASQSVLVGVDSVDGSATGCDSYLFHKCSYMLGLYYTTAPDDYGSVNSVYVFDPPSTRECIDVTIVDDNISEDPEDFSLTLSIPVTTVPLELGTPNSTTVTIPRNDGIIQYCVLV